MKPHGIIMNEDHTGCLSEAKAERERKRFCDLRSLTSFSFLKGGIFSRISVSEKLHLGGKELDKHQD